MSNDTLDVNLANIMMPRGAIIMWYTKPIPDGWQICDGSDLQGEGSPIKTPNLNGRFIRGASFPDDKINENRGDGESLTLQSSQLPRIRIKGDTLNDGSHTHHVATPHMKELAHKDHGGGIHIWQCIPGSGPDVYTTDSKTGNHHHSVDFTIEAGNGSGKQDPINFKDILPPFQGLFFIMKQ